MGTIWMWKRFRIYASSSRRRNSQMPWLLLRPLDARWWSSTHHAAHVFQDTAADLVDEKTVRPYDPFHFHHHLIHRKEAHYRGERVPEESEFL